MPRVGFEDASVQSSEPHATGAVCGLTPAGLAAIPSFLYLSAQGESRTPMSLRPQRSERCVYTISPPGQN